MGLRFFADHCVPNSVIQGLFDAGHEVIRLKDHIPIESPDRIVIAAEQELDLIQKIAKGIAHGAERKALLLFNLSEAFRSALKDGASRRRAGECE